MMSPAMTTQLPLPLSLPFNSFLSTLPPLHCGKAKRPIARSICGGKRQASQRGDTGRPRYNQMADYWTKRLEFQRHNDTHLPLPPSLLLPCHSTLGHSHTSGPLSSRSPIDVCCGRNVQRLRRFINRSARKSKREGSWILGQISSY